MKPGGTRARQRMCSSDLTAPEAEPLTVPAHHLLCAVCVRGGCKSPPPGKSVIDGLLKALWQYPYVTLKITADLDVNRAHFLDVYGGRHRKALPPDYERREADHDSRRKDMEVCRRLGIVPGSTMGAFTAYSILLGRAPALDGICRTGSRPSRDWPQCPCAGKGYYEKIAQEPRRGLAEQTREGEQMDGKGIWALLRPRSRQDMLRAKRESARYILEEADHLYIRPNHLLCILCTAGVDEPLIQDNLVELRQRMEQEPDIPVTLIEGCCMVCDSCNIYHEGEHLCYGTHIKNQLRDLRMLEILGLRPGGTLPARELYALVYERIGALRDVCAWGDELNTAPFWAPCGGWQTDAYEKARAARLIAGA